MFVRKLCRLHCSCSLWQQLPRPADSHEGVDLLALTKHCETGNTHWANVKVLLVLNRSCVLKQRQNVDVFLWQVYSSETRLHDPVLLWATFLAQCLQPCSINWTRWMSLVWRRSFYRKVSAELGSKATGGQIWNFLHLYVYKKSGYAVMPNWNLEGEKFVYNGFCQLWYCIHCLSCVCLASFLRLSTLLKCAASLCCQAKTGPWGRHGWTLIGAWHSNVVC